VGNRRLLSYSGLSHGNYTLRLRAALNGEPSEPVSYSFEVLPRFYETNWFRAGIFILVLGLAWLGYKWRERQIHSRFELVLRERTRLAQELHDTMSQAFVGISSQLDGVYLTLPADAGPARDHLDIARRMARHSHTEAQRSIMDLRDAALDDEDLSSALESNARLWTSGSGVDLDVSFVGAAAQVPDTVAHQVLRIAQESITNALKHAGATKIQVKLEIQPAKLQLSVTDNGRGFDRDGVFLTAKGHFGLIGMRERAQRLRGTLHISSRPGLGTNVELSVPL
jgi:signal transduction histidine kinase